MNRPLTSSGSVTKTLNFAGSTSRPFSSRVSSCSPWKPRNMVVSSTEWDTVPLRPTFFHFNRQKKLPSGGQPHRTSSDFSRSPSQAGKTSNLHDFGHLPTREPVETGRCDRFDLRRRLRDELISAPKGL